MLGLLPLQCCLALLLINHAAECKRAQPLAPCPGSCCWTSSRTAAPCPSPPLQTTSTIAATQWASLGVDAAFDLARFKRGFDINITRYEGDDMEFEMKGVSCAVRALASDGGALKQGHLACVTAALSAETMALH